MLSLICIKSYSTSTVSGLKNVALASMDALQNYFFWTWKIGNSTRLGTSSCPMWHYKLGMQQGWIPKGSFTTLFLIMAWLKFLLRITDPREATGFCANLLGTSQPFDGTYPSTATGGVSSFTWVFILFTIWLFGFFHTCDRSGWCRHTWPSAQCISYFPSCNDLSLLFRHRCSLATHIHTYWSTEDFTCPYIYSSSHSVRRFGLE